MDSKVDICPKCGCDMEPGYVLDRIHLGTGGKPLLWVRGDQRGFSTLVKPGDESQIEVDTYRCIRCGYLELYAGIGSEGDAGERDSSS